MKIKIINGVNMGLLGTREVPLYGATSFDAYFQQLSEKYPDVTLAYEQHDSLDALVKAIHAAAGYDGVILNPGAYTHTSIVLADAVKAVSVPVVEVHVTNLFARENYRRKSYLSGCCSGFVAGFGLKGYELALLSFVKN